MAMQVQDGTGALKNLQTGSGDGGATPWVSPAATGIGTPTDATATGVTSASLIALNKAIVNAILTNSVLGKVGIDQTTPGTTNAVARPDPAKTTGTITAQDSGSTSVTNSLGQNVVTGTPTANSSVSATLSGHATVRIQLVSGTFSGTVVFERSFDGGTTWFGVNALAPGSTTGATVSSVVFTGASTQLFEINASGATNIRVRSTAPVTNSLAVTIQPGYGVGVVTTGSIPTRTNSYRNGGVLHRSARTAADKLGTVGAITLTGTTGGTLSPTGVTYYVSAAAYNKWGNALPAAVVSGVPGAGNSALNAAFAGVTNAEGYDIFLSVDSGAPKWVGRITEAQRASGIIISALGTTSVGGTAGGVQINVVGTQLQTTSPPYTTNNAYTPATVASNENSINCTGFSKAIIHSRLTVTDLRSAPSLSLVPFFQDQTSNTDWFLDAIQSQLLTLLTADGAPLEQQIILDVSGATAMVVLISQISGQGASEFIWVELV